MRIISLELHNFRCFPFLNLEFEKDKDIVFITGSNGIGKTSILESLHYCCYLRSFKTHVSKELISIGNNSCNIITSITTKHTFDVLNVKLGHTKKIVKLNQKSISSFKELYNLYKVITMTEDDLKLVQEGPLFRRSFLDQVISLADPSYIQILKKYKQILDNRNALIMSGAHDNESYVIWTEQLLKISNIIQKKRVDLLISLEVEIKTLLKHVLNYLTSFSFDYQYAHPYTEIVKLSSANEIFNRYPKIKGHEVNQKRTLFGAHLDDIKITFDNKSSRIYASRGQQKLIVIILKLAQMSYISKIYNQDQNERNLILLLDDFITDFDLIKIKSLFPLMMNLSSQIIITSALEQSPLNSILASYNTQYIKLESKDLKVKS